MKTPTPQPETNPGEVLAVMWRRWLEAAQSIARVEADLHSEYMEKFGGETWDSLWSPDACPVSNGHLRLRADEVLCRLRWQAETRFAPPGSDRLRIDQEPLRVSFIQPLVSRLDEHPFEHFHAEQFDPAAVWDGLEALYGGSRGADHHHRSQAERIARFFDLGPGVSVQRRKAGIVLRASVRVDRRDAFSGGRFWLSYGDQGGLLGALAGLADCARWAECATAAGAFAHLARILPGAFTRGILSRQRYDLPENGGVLKLYQTSVELFLAPPLSDKLPLYLALFGPYATSSEEVA